MKFYGFIGFDEAVFALQKKTAPFDKDGTA